MGEGNEVLEDGLGCGGVAGDVEGCWVRYRLVRR